MAAVNGHGWQRRGRRRRIERERRIAALFRIERSLGGAPRKKREKIRQKRSQPIVDRFFSWCDAEASSVLDDTPISDGIRYARNQRVQRVGLMRFLEDGRLPIHNNWSELELRRQAQELALRRPRRCRRGNATFTSLLASCRLHDVEPWTYLRDIFCLLPAWSDHRLLELAPVEWTATRERDDCDARSTSIPSAG